MSDPSQPYLFEPSWLALLRRRAGATSIAATAAELGYSRTAISLVLDGKYNKSTARIERAVLAKLDTVDCPYLGAEIGRESCDRHRQRPIPQSDIPALRHWKACRRCPVRKASEAKAAGTRILTPGETDAA